MRALVVGGSGFIGSHLVDKLVSQGWDVYVYDQAMERYRPPLAGVQYILGAFDELAGRRKALEKVDVLFHLVSTSTPGSSNKNPALDFQENVLPSIGLMESCLEQKVGKLIFFSSGGAVYGAPQRTPIPEDHPTNPESSYGIVKLTIEKYLDLYHRLYGLEYTIIRPSNPYGPRQNPLGLQGAISVFLGKSCSGQPIEVWGDGSVVRDYIYVEDLVDGVVRIASADPMERIYNLGYGEGVSVNELLDHIRRVTRLDPVVRYLPMRKFDPHTVVLDTGRAQTEFGWKPLVGLDDGIEKVYRFILGSL
jgi:Nucleoside-diphosphate-sugar epimerases